MPQQTYTLKKIVEYGGVMVTSLQLDDDISPMQIRDIDLGQLTKVSEMSKAAAALTRQPLELIESLGMADWMHVAQQAANILGNSLTPNT